MDGLGLPAGELAHAFGSPACGGCQQDVQAHLLQQRHNAPHRRGFAGAGAAGEDHDPLSGGQLHRLPLEGSVDDALLALDLLHRLERLGAGVGGGGEQAQQPHTGGPLRLPQPPQVAGLHIGHLFLDHGTLLQQLIQGLLHLVRAAGEQLGCGADQLVPGQEHMASAVFVVAQLKGHRRLEPLPAVRVHAQLQGDLVRDGELHTAGVAGEQVRVLLHLFQCGIAVLAAQLHGQHRRQLIPGQKGHQPPQAHVTTEALRNLLGLFGGDALDGGQPLRLPLQNVQRFGAEAVHNALRRGGAHALAHAGGQVAGDLRLLLRQAPLQLRGPQLGTVLGMGLPQAGHRQVLSRRGAGDAAHHRDHLALLGQEAQDRIAVFGVLKNDAMYGALAGGQTFHVLGSLSFRGLTPV